MVTKSYRTILFGQCMSIHVFSAASLVQACTTGDLTTVKQLLEEGGSVHETSEEGESLLSLACSAGYFGLAKVCCVIEALPRSCTLFLVNSTC